MREGEKGADKAYVICCDENHRKWRGGESDVPPVPGSSCCPVVLTSVAGDLMLVERQCVGVCVHMLLGGLLRLMEEEGSPIQSATSSGAYAALCGVPASRLKRLAKQLRVVL